MTWRPRWTSAPQHWDSPPCDPKYQTVSGVLPKLLTVRSGSEEREPHR